VMRRQTHSVGLEDALPSSGDHWPLGAFPGHGTGERWRLVRQLSRICRLHGRSMDARCREVESPRRHAPGLAAVASMFPNKQTNTLCLDDSAPKHRHGDCAASGAARASLTRRARGDGRRTSRCDAMTLREPCRPKRGGWEAKTMQKAFCRAANRSTQGNKTCRCARTDWHAAPARLRYCAPIALFLSSLREPPWAARALLSPLNRRCDALPGTAQRLRRSIGTRSQRIHVASQASQRRARSHVAGHPRRRAACPQRLCIVQESPISGRPGPCRAGKGVRSASLLSGAEPAASCWEQGCAGRLRLVRS
jgi:hypothetical protein